MNLADADAARRRVRTVIEGLVIEGKSVVARSDGTSHKLFPVAASPAEGESLREWVIREEATRTIEVGLGYGISALYICEGLLTNTRRALHVAIDPHQATRFADCALQFLSDAGVLELVEHHCDESQIVLPLLLGARHEFDLAFVDGNHRFDGIFVDLVYLGRLVRPGGIVFVDDYQLPSVTRAVSFFISNMGWKLEEHSSADRLHHWVVLRTAAKIEPRSYDHFVEF
jgi:predicted O-methyltransferase YrrM